MTTVLNTALTAVPTAVRLAKKTHPRSSHDVLGALPLKKLDRFGHFLHGGSVRKPERLVPCSVVSGSPGLETSEVSPDPLDSILVYDLNGDGIPISDLWKDRKAVVAFARHFGCVLCRKRADYLLAHKEKMDAAGVALVLIGPGSIDQARAFSEQAKFKGEVYADPSYSSYQAFKFVSGVSTTFTPGSGLKIVQAYIEGYRQDWGLSFEEDTRTRSGWQQGGIIVAGPGKSFSYFHKDKEAGDDPDIEGILEACCSQGT